METCPKESSLSGYAPSSSIHAASPLEALMGILRSPLEVWMMRAIERKMFSS